MDKAQFESLKTVEQGGNKRRIHLTSKDFSKNTNSRTLLYGYTCDRETWHVFQDYHGLVYLYVYKDVTSWGLTEIQKVDVSGDGIESLTDLIPNKRLYPQYCDFEFCEWLKGQGVFLPFTTWTDPKPISGVFVGEIF